MYIVGGGAGGAGTREIRGWEAGEERAGSGSSKGGGGKKAGEKCEMLFTFI